MTIDEAAFREFEPSRHDELASSYHEFFVPVTRLASLALLDAAAVAPGTRVLDVATGSGAVASSASGRSAFVVGIDISGNMLTLARRFHPTIEFSQADVQRLPFPDGTFDAVVCNFGLGHFPDAHRAMGECVRVLRSGGYVAVSWWDTPARQRIQGLFVDALQEAHAEAVPGIPTGPPMFRFSEDAALLELLRSVGLNSVSLRRFADYHEALDAEALWRASLGSLARTSAIVVGQSEKIQKRIRDIFERLASAYAQDGRLRIPISFKVAAGKSP